MKNHNTLKRLAKHLRKKTRKHLRKKTRKQSRKYLQKGGALTLGDVEILNSSLDSRENKRIEFKLNLAETQYINTKNIIDIPNDGNCTYTTIANSLNSLYGGMTSESLRGLLADNIDNEYCLMLLFMSYKSIADPNVRVFLENGRRPLSSLYNIPMHKYLETHGGQCINVFFLKNKDLDIYELLFDRTVQERFYRDCISECKDISIGLDLIKNIIRRNAIGIPIANTSISPNSLLFLDTNHEIHYLMNYLNFVIIEIDVDDRNQSLSIIKGNDTQISDETRYIIMKIQDNHTNGYDKQIAYLYNALPIEISNPIIRHLRTV